MLGCRSPTSNPNRLGRVQAASLTPRGSGARSSHRRLVLLRRGRKKLHTKKAILPNVDERGAWQTLAGQADFINRRVCHEECAVSEAERLVVRLHQGGWLLAAT